MKYSCWQSKSIQETLSVTKVTLAKLFRDRRQNGSYCSQMQKVSVYTMWFNTDRGGMMKQICSAWFHHGRKERFPYGRTFLLLSSKLEENQPVMDWKRKLAGYKVIWI